VATIYLIRHGQASFGSANYDQLSELGCRQAEVLGHYLRDCGIHLDAAYSGSLERQKKTAALALASQPQPVVAQIDDRFNEVRNEEQVEQLLPLLMAHNSDLRTLVEAGFKDSKSYQKVIEAVFSQWTSSGFEHPGIQSWADYSGGVRAALAKVMREQGSGKNVAIFTSGGTIATAVSQVLGLSGEQAYQFYEPVINCSVSQLFYSGDKVSLSYFNDHSSLRVLGQQLGENLISYR
jgi:broad specificity phosphatase PhoE